ncbi:aminotransferase class I/II-fold pyridoxal phosphate-dependent enzyme [Synechococcus sp. Cruz-9H2]|uniref:DegT/DnrJ/EryC1/StrS family aminotransferase n=1 Tax=unclassified Synechococcus TaxID=2626047 RepID=UPI0020CB746D|nr:MULTISPECIES: aminotransferase class I/II-fold pyridoxal phosphate-dependent enzyme [unclassified Synechococcus]MCP9820358.1 aminotransferase class I/II-fold pyridoxal phosphate-dependent enzyme [Synechococcus sp. Cruz-9H2]MCP9844666.1 aminotransferase class I/II-fold pyridoxal phosphate-dependent enzyme [Synechococcus sp. Edmonson 11F2]MCP9856788.1 aminotransferase class I/II-fold pyridoxal phosphate-dependent enzyme [Synechococcus sp. Cruz-9C9]MCP9864002.1 aminotransferase class I/II-fold 
MCPGGHRLGLEEEEAAVAAVREVMRSKKLFRHFGVTRNLLQPSRVLQLENAFARRMRARHALAVNSGTSAIVCALRGLGIGPGDEVILPSYSWVSTASAVVSVGAVPILAEIDESLTLDPADVEAKISPLTRAILAVHMRGAPARLDVLLDLASRRGLFLIEDVAQSLGASFFGKQLGTLGDAGVFSFQMSKILTAGEGGMLLSAEQLTHERAVMYHDSAVCLHRGVELEDWIAGLNLRMSELHAAILLVQLDRLDDILNAMRERKKQLLNVIKNPLERRGISFRALHDEQGDAATSLVFFLPDASKVQPVIDGLLRENVPASRMYNDLAFLPRDPIDLHVYTSWAPILKQRAWSASGAPWSGHPRPLDIDSNPCPRTLALLRRAVHIDINPELSFLQVDQIGKALLRTVH